eukprot:gene12433-213_t
MLGAPELPARIFPVSPHKVAPFSTFFLPFSILLSGNVATSGETRRDFTILPEKQCEWPAVTLAGPEWNNELPPRWFNQTRGSNASHFCSSTLGGPGATTTTTTNRRDDPCIIIGTHHKAGTHLSRALRNLVAEHLGLKMFGSGKCDGLGSVDGKRDKVRVPYEPTGLKFLCHLDDEQLKVAEQTSCKVVHVVRRPSRMVSSQHAYQLALRQVDFNFRDGMSENDPFYKALQNKDWRGMWGATYSFMKPKISTMLASITQSRNAHTGCTLTLDIDADFRDNFDDTITALLMHILPGRSPQAICEMRLAATAQDTSRHGVKVDESRGGSHIASLRTIRAREQELKTILSSEELGDENSGSGWSAQLKSEDAKFDAAMELLERSSW